MLNKALRIAMILAVVAVVSAAAANAQSLMLRATVPFAFTSGNTHLPAGDYRLSMDPIFPRIVLQNLDGGGGMYMNTSVVKTPKTITKASLVFRRYGDNYFLHAVHDPARSISIEWPASKAERELARTLTPVEVALTLPAVR